MRAPYFTPSGQRAPLSSVLIRSNRLPRGWFAFTFWTCKETVPQASCVILASQTCRGLREYFRKGYLAFGIERHDVDAHGSSIGDMRLNFAGIREYNALGRDSEVEHLRYLCLASTIKARTQCRKCGEQRRVRAALHGVEWLHSWHRLHPLLEQSNE